MRRFAKAAVSAALAAALAVGGIAPAVALAEVGTDTGTITVTPVSNNTDVKYCAYKLFTCDVDLKPGSTDTYSATSISWASDNMGTVIERAIKTYDNTYTGTTAQQAADYIVNTITDTDGTTRVGANGFAENLTKAIDDVTDPAPTVLTAGTATEMTEGYYLIVSQQGSLTGVKTGTAPIFTMLGNGQALTITEKTSVPTLTKTVVEDSAASEQRHYADAQAGQAVGFVLTGTVPDSINTFTSYYCTFADQLPAGMDLVCAEDSFAESDVTVQIAVGSTPTVYTVDAESFAATYADRVLTVEFADLKLAKDASGNTIPVDATAQVIVSYQASLNADGTVGAPGNTNTATMTYANNPQNIQDSTARSTSTQVQATVYEYQLKLYKYDKTDLESDTKTPVTGAKFTIQATDADDDASTGRYVQENGTLGADAYEFETDANGLISVKGLDAGSYTISETGAPTGYETIAEDLTLTITPSFWAEDDADLGSNVVGSLKAVSATLEGGNDDSEYTKVDADLTSNGTVTIQVTDEKQSSISLPLTGLSGVTLVYVVGGTILAASLAVIVRRRLSSED